MERVCELMTTYCKPKVNHLQIGYAGKESPAVTLLFIAFIHEVVVRSSNSVKHALHLAEPQFLQADL